VLQLLESDDSDDRAAAVSALAEIADVSSGSVVPVLPTLAETIDDLSLERQRELSTIFEAVASESPEEISDEVIESLVEFYGQDIEYWQQDTEVAREILETGLSVAESVGSTEMRLSCHVALGEVALKEENSDVAAEHFEAVLDSDDLSRVTNALSRSLQSAAASTERPATGVLREKRSRDRAERGTQPSTEE
jgi:hypothetical protein